MRNVLVFAAMVAVCGALLELSIWAFDFFEISGIRRLCVFLAMPVLHGVLGHFVFAGDARLRTMLVFFSVVVFGGVAVIVYDPGKTFYPLLNSLPLAAISAVITNAIGRFVEHRRSRYAPKVESAPIQPSEAGVIGATMSEPEQTAVTEPWEYRTTIYFVSAVLVIMAIYEIAGGTAFTVPVGVAMLASAAGLIRRLRWGRTMSVVMMWLLLIFAIGSILPSRIEVEKALGVESPSASMLVVQLVVMCSVALASLHFLSTFKDRFRSGKW